MKRAAVLILLLLALGSIVLSKKTFRPRTSHKNIKMPIIYTDDYNIRFFGIQKLHPFDSEKYKKVYDYLVDTCGISKNSFIKPERTDDSTLLTIHTKRYIDSLKSSANAAKIAEMPLLGILPNFIIQNNILDPMKLAVGGTIKGAKLAMELGWAINLSGGYHHAKADSGGGFCFFADIPLALNNLRESNKNIRALIIDLDAHQGNGFEAILKDDKRVFILDIYNKDIYPQDYSVMKYIDLNIPISSYIDDEKYLEIIRKAIPVAVKKSRPDIIFYNAGTDILVNDPLGHLSITEKGIIARDEIVFRNAIERKIPILMVLSGGYTKRSGMIIGKSIENILKNVIVSQ